jgi:hypothetical protein
MRYAVFSMLAADAPWAMCVGMAMLVNDAEAMAARSLAEGRVVSIRSISHAEAQQLASLDTWCAWVRANELPGIEFLPVLNRHGWPLDEEGER